MYKNLIYLSHLSCSVHLLCDRQVVFATASSLEIYEQATDLLAAGLQTFVSQKKKIGEGRSVSEFHTAPT